MPVIVIGADTETGMAAVRALLRRDGEVRAFATDPAAAGLLRDLGVKTAVGDVSDASHVAGAALRCFSAVLVTEAAEDARIRSFADRPADVLAGWADALAEAGVRRAIWVGGGPPSRTTPETIRVGIDERTAGEIAEEIADLDEAAAL